MPAGSVALARSMKARMAAVPNAEAMPRSRKRAFFCARNASRIAARWDGVAATTCRTAPSATSLASFFRSFLRVSLDSLAESSTSPEVGSAVP